MSSSGQCLCGKVSFVAEVAEPHYHACHCGMCRRWGGGPGMAITCTSVKFSGKEHMTTYDSSEWAARGFCSSCGANLFYHFKEPDSYMMQVGCFDDQSAFDLAGEIYIDHKPAGYEFKGNHPKQTEAEFLASMGVEQP